MSAFGWGCLFGALLWIAWLFWWTREGFKNMDCLMGDDDE